MAEKCGELFNLFNIFVYKIEQSTKIKYYTCGDDKLESLQAHVDIRLKDDDEFKEKFKNLNECISDEELKKNVTTENIIFLETITNGKFGKNKGISGLGKEFFKLIKRDFTDKKYVFLYPSKEFGGTSDQQNLMKYYESLGFKTVSKKPCTADFGNGMSETNIFDGDADYYLMIAEISKLILDDVIKVKEITVEELERLKKEKEEGEPDKKRANLEQKYLKYKQKYLQLKSQLNKLKLN
jgi:hypothetical protein